MTTALTRLAGSAFELTISVPWSDVKKIYDQVFEELASTIEVEGFRKGKAPKEVVESKIDKGKIYGEVINRIVPESYQKALAEHGLKPIISPKVQIASAEEEKDWQVIIHSTEKPQVELNGYKDATIAINASGKIWKPGENEKVEEKNEEEEKSKKVSAIIDKLLEVCKVELAKILIESEAHRLISQLVEDVRQAGLTFEQYLQSSQQTQDQVHEKYHKQAETALKLEFILEAVADDLDVKITQEEIDAVINKEASKERQEMLRQQSYVIASLLRRDKTISKLLTL